MQKPEKDLDNVKGPGKPPKRVFKQKGLNPREGQPAHTTEAIGSGAGKGMRARDVEL